MFIDELTIHIKAGKGGPGVERWLHEKGKEFSGPSGGNGGKGGDVYVTPIRDVGLLSQYRHVKEFKSEDGGTGEKNSRHGAKGEDLIVKLPVGSIVTNTMTGRVVTLSAEGQIEKILNGVAEGSAMNISSHLETFVQQRRLQELWEMKQIFILKFSLLRMQALWDSRMLESRAC